MLADALDFERIVHGTIGSACDDAPGEGGTDLSQRLQSCHRSGVQIDLERCVRGEQLRRGHECVCAAHCHAGTLDSNRRSGMLFYRFMDNSPYEKRWAFAVSVHPKSHVVKWHCV